MSSTKPKIYVKCALGNPKIEECRNCVHLNRHRVWKLREEQKCTDYHGCTRFESDMVGQANCEITSD